MAGRNSGAAGGQPGRAAGKTQDGDRRGRTRQPIVRNAVVAFGPERLSCSVRDISDTGARLIMASTAGVPDRFQLTVTAERQVYNVEVARRSETELGVAFQGPPVTVAPKPDAALRHFSAPPARR